MSPPTAVAPRRPPPPDRVGGKRKTRRMMVPGPRWCGPRWCRVHSAGPRGGRWRPLPRRLRRQVVRTHDAVQGVRNIRRSAEMFQTRPGSRARLGPGNGLDQRFGSTGYPRTGRPARRSSCRFPAGVSTQKVRRSARPRHTQARGSMLRRHSTRRSRKRAAECPGSVGGGPHVASHPFGVDAGRGRSRRAPVPVNDPRMGSGRGRSARGRVASTLQPASAAVSVCSSSVAIVIGPTPPGTGVIQAARSAAAANSTSPTLPAL